MAMAVILQARREEGFNPMYGDGLVYQSAPSAMSPQYSISGEAFAEGS